MGGAKWRLAMSTACCPSSIPKSPTRAISGGRRRADLDKAIGGAHRQPHEERYKIPKHRYLPYSCGRSTIRPAEPAATLR
jgi:hypothetical protein